jgi:hypothetical protein
MEFIMRGILKLFTEVQISPASGSEMHFDRKVFKRVTLATYYGVKSEANLNGYVSQFRDLNPHMSQCHINYEFVIREFG